MIDKDVLKNSLSRQDILKLMQKMGSNLMGETSDAMIFQTVCHNPYGGGSNKLYYYPQTKTFMCYTKCGSDSIYGIVMKHFNSKNYEMNFPESIRYVSDVTGKIFNEEDGFKVVDDKNFIDDWEILNKYKRIKEKDNKKKIELDYLDPNTMTAFANMPHISWIEEGISIAAHKKYGIRYDWRDEKIVIPHKDKDGNLIGIRGRALKKKDLEEGRKYMPMYLYGENFAHSLGANLYGYYENKKAIEKLKKMIVFEGEKSVLKCYDYYKDSNIAVAVCGSSISSIQKDLIISSGVEEVMIAFDKEYEDLESQEYLDYKKKMINIAKTLAPYCRVYLLWDMQEKLEKQDSPADKGKEVLNNLIQEKIEVTTN